MNLVQLFFAFFRIGAFGFGGMGSMLSMLQKDLVEQKKVITASDITESLTYTKLLPGSTVVQIASYLGWKLQGWPGAAVATFAFVLPGFVMMLALSLLYTRVIALPNVSAGLRGLSAAVVGMLITTCWQLGQSTIKSKTALAFMIVAFILAVVFEWPLALIVVGAGGLGMIVYAIEGRTNPTKQKAKM